MNIFNDNDYAQAHARLSEKDGWKNIISSLLFILTAPLIAWLMIVFVFQSYEVFGSSMANSLQNGDRLIVVKATKNWHKLQGRDYIPQRGEIVVIDRPPSISGVSGDVEHLIKRVIGLPGERVVISNGEVRIYNQKSPNGFDPDKAQVWSRNIIRTPGDVDITVGKDEVFIVGDNRNNSKDSRDFGAVNVDLIVGVAKLRFAPVDEFQTF